MKMCSGNKYTDPMQPQGLHDLRFGDFKKFHAENGAAVEYPDPRRKLEEKIRVRRDVAGKATTIISENLTEAEDLEALLRELPSLSPRASKVMVRLLERA